MSKIIKTIIILIILVIIVFILLKVVKIQNIVLKRIYVTDYSEYVHQYAEEYEIDPFLIFAIIKAESNFDKNAVSKSDAMGLMQLMNPTAEELANKLKIDYTSKMLFDPEINIQLGVKYYSDLYARYENIEVALTAYNAGIGNVDGWIEKRIIQKDGSDIENVPFKETNNYVRKILRDYNIYKQLYMI